MDGLTIVLTYQNGTLVKAVTRGNGEIGEVITANAKAFVNVPLNISYQGELILRGEAIIRYSDFEKINEQIEDVDAKYKNPRNLCSGSVRQLNSEITAQRQVHFYAFSLVKADGINFKNSRKEQFEWLKTQGFEVVEYHEVTKETLPETVKMYSERLRKMIRRRMDWCFCMMILPTASRWGGRQNSRAIRSHSSGRMRFRRRSFSILNGARRERG